MSQNERYRTKGDFMTNVVYLPEIVTSDDYQVGYYALREADEAYDAIVHSVIIDEYVDIKTEELSLLLQEEISRLRKELNRLKKFIWFCIRGFLNLIRSFNE